MASSNSRWLGYWSHSYYYQVQMEMFCTNTGYNCRFSLWTGRVQWIVLKWGFTNAEMFLYCGNLAGIYSQRYGNQRNGSRMKMPLFRKWSRLSLERNTLTVTQHTHPFVSLLQFKWTSPLNSLTWLLQSTNDARNNMYISTLFMWVFTTTIYFWNSKVSHNPEVKE